MGKVLINGYTYAVYKCKNPSPCAKTKLNYEKIY